VIQDPGGFQELEEGGWANRYFDEEALLDLGPEFLENLKGDSTA
jgi:hypothetical protein